MNSNRSIFESYLETLIKQDNCVQTLIKENDDNYSKIYGFLFTPCCFPLECTTWLNETTPGIFFRCFFPICKDNENLHHAVDLMTTINYSLPTGCFVLNPQNRQILYKHGVYFGGMELNEEFLEGVFRPSFEFIAMYWEDLLKKILGYEINHKH